MEMANYRGLAAVLFWGTLLANAAMADGVYVDKPRRTAVVGYSESGAVGETVTFKYCKMETGSNAPFARGCTPLLLPNSSPRYLPIYWRTPKGCLPLT